MANSLPVVIASNQTAIPVSQSGSWVVAAGDNNIGNVDIVSTPTRDDEDFNEDAGTDTHQASGIYLSGFAASATVLRDDSGFGENVTGGIAMIHARLWDGSAYDRWSGNSTDGALVNLGTNNDVVSAGNIPHDSADSGNPLKIGSIAYSPDGTTPGTAVAELDRTNAKGDLDGRIFMNDEHPRWWSYHEDSSNALTDASVAADPGDGFQVVITEIIFSTGAATACNIFFEEGSTKVLGPWYLEAVAGRGLVWRGKKHITASTAVTVTTSAAIAHGLDVQGYIQAV